MKNRERTERTRNTILEAAYRVIHEKGFRAASLGEILQGTGLTKGALYHHFPDKMSLGYAMVEEYLQVAVVGRWVGPLERMEDPVRGLADMMRNVFSGFPDDEVRRGCPVANLAAEMSPVDEGFRIRVNRIYALLEEGISAALERGKAKGHVREDVNAMKAAVFYTAAMAGARSLAKNDGRQVLLDSAEMVGLFLESLRP